MFGAKCKYIVMGDNELQIEKIVVFDATTDHKQMAKGMKRTMRLPDVISAGFIDEFGKCFGRSVTLGVSSRQEEDTKLFKKMLGFDDKKIVFVD